MVCTKDHAKNNEKYILASKFNDGVANIDHAKYTPSISWALSESFESP